MSFKTVPINRQFTSLVSLVDACDIIMGQSDEIPVSIFKTFLGVCVWGGEGAANQPLQLQELAEKVGAPVTSVSRHLRYLGDWERIGVEGMGLVRTDIYQLNRRQKVASLTPKGVRVAEQLRRAVERAQGYGYSAEQGGTVGG